MKDAPTVEAAEARVRAAWAEVVAATRALNAARRRARDEARVKRQAGD